MRRQVRSYVPTLNLLTIDIDPISTETVRSEAFDVFQGWDRSIWVEVSSAGVPNVKVSYEVAYWDEASNTFSDYVAPEDGGILDTGLGDTNLHVYNFNPPVCASAKIVFKGQGANPADVSVVDLRGSWGNPE